MINDISNLDNMSVFENQHKSISDYSKVINDFGLEQFKVDKFPNPNMLMRRGVVFAGRDLSVISKCICFLLLEKKEKGV